MSPCTHIPSRAATVLALAALVGCSDDRVTDPAAPVAPPSAAFSSAPAAPGTALVFLPSLGPTVAVYHGAFDGTRSPVVEICRWTGSACSGAPVARYTRTSGTGGEPLRVVLAEQHYRADWKQKDRPAGAVYRVRVLLDGVELGAASARVLRAGETEAQVVAAGYAPVSQSQTVIVRFRLETSGDYLPGAPGEPAAAAIPLEDFVPRAADYSTGHPALPGAVLSHNTLVLVPKPGVTVGQLNGLLAEIGAERVGGIPGSAGSAAGLLALRLPDGTHAGMQATLARLRSDARVAAAVQDARVADDAVTALPTDLPWNLNWGLVPSGANWGLEAIRAPQLWNLNPGVERALLAPGHAEPLVGVLDGGFLSGHGDLAYAANLTPDRISRHGTMVAGIIGAAFDNRKGIDGVNPFARLVVGAVHVDSGGPTYVARRTTSSVMLLWDLYRMLRDRPAIRVVNVSQGYNWYAARPRISMLDTTVQRIATAHGAAAVEMLRSLQTANGALPVIVVSAGNASSEELGMQPAAYSSPLANAALVHGAAPVIVVEASGNAGGGSLVRGDFSNWGGHVSAPGVNVVSTDSLPGRYEMADGTSFAAPHVAGVASYLYALHPNLPAPTLTQNVVRQVLVAGGAAAPGLAPHLDAFAAALRLDLHLGGEHVLRTLVDVDDGTLDGNTRTSLDGSDFTLDVHGDGAVDMSDFRRWRDWYLVATRHPGVQLDGSVRHDKHDVNDNHRWTADGDDENVYPRGDFNGDGVLSATARRAVPGLMGGLPATDLEVLQRLFDDGEDGYAKAELPALLASADLTIEAASCLAGPGVARVRVRVHPSGGAVPLTGRRHDAARPTRVHTVAVADGAHTVLVEALDASGEVVAAAEQEVGPLAPGADVRWAPTCEAEEDEVPTGAPLVFARGFADSPSGISARILLPSKGYIYADPTEPAGPGELHSYSRTVHLSDDVDYTDYELNNGRVIASAALSASGSVNVGVDALGRVTSIDAQASGSVSGSVTIEGQLYGAVLAGGEFTMSLAYAIEVGESVTFAGAGECGTGSVQFVRWMDALGYVGTPQSACGGASGTLEPGRYQLRLSGGADNASDQYMLYVRCTQLGTMAGCWTGSRSDTKQWSTSAQITFTPVAAGARAATGAATTSR